jgi:chromosome segregation ATPase
MKYLKKYKLFLEEDEFDVKDNDKEDVKMSKEGLNDLKSKISEYNSKKSKIDQLYKGTEDPSGDDLEKIIGKEEDRNEFLTSYSNISSIKNKIKKLQDKSDKKTIELSNFKDRLSIASNEMGPDLSNKIKEINDELVQIKKDIQEKIKKVPEMEKEHSERMLKKEEEIKNWIEKIQ